MAHAWKACWCNSLTSSNLVFSASRVFEAIRKPFFMPGNGFLSAILTSLAHMPFCRAMSSSDVGYADIGDTLGDTHDGPNRLSLYRRKELRHDPSSSSGRAYIRRLPRPNPRPGRRFHAFCTFPVGEKGKRSLEFQRFHNIFLYRRTAAPRDPHQYYSLNSNQVTTSHYFSLDFHVGTCCTSGPGSTNPLKT